jgi:predicted lysophospholipase L1 biosynthesis ABC-type transport system permease subunit
MRKQRERQANRVFAMAAVAILAVLLLSDMSLWVILVPVWLVSLLVTQIALQHYATNEKPLATIEIILGFCSYRDCSGRKTLMMK